MSSPSPHRDDRHHSTSAHSGHHYPSSASGSSHASPLHLSALHSTFHAHDDSDGSGTPNSLNSSGGHSGSRTPASTSTSHHTPTHLHRAGHGHGHKPSHSPAHSTTSSKNGSKNGSKPYFGRGGLHGRRSARKPTVIKKKLTDKELRDKLEQELQAEEIELLRQANMGENSAALEIQTVHRGGKIRRYNEELAVEAGAVTLQSVQRGHSERRHMDPFLYPVEPDKIANAAKSMLAHLSKPITPMLTLEDRSTLEWETVGYVDPVREKERSRGRVYADNEVYGEWDKEPEEGEDIFTRTETPNGVLIKKKKLHPTGPVKMEPNVKDIITSVNLISDPDIPIANEDMMVWLGKMKKNDHIPLDMKVREKRREDKFSMFSDFVDQTLELLDDFEEREKMIQGVDALKVKVANIIYKDERDFQDCHFEEQLQHEYLLEKPLVSQRKFEEAYDNYARDPKELKILLATIRRIDKFDCTFLACKLIRYHIDDNLCHMISKALRGNEYLQALYLNDNFITDSGALSLADSLKNNVNMKMLNLSGNFISDEGANGIADMLRENKNILDINLGFKAKKRPYRDNKSPYPRITAPGGSMIAFALQDNYSVTSIDLSNMKIWDAGAAAFAMTLRTRHTLKHVNLSYNDIGVPGGLSLARALESNRGLLNFNLAGNNFDDKVGFKFAAALRGAVTLEGSHHGLGGDGMNVLETLDMHSNELSMLSIRAIRNSVAENKTLRVVSVYDNRGIGELGLRNDPNLDNLVVANIRRYKEDECIKNLVIWHKRLFKKETRCDYDHFLEIQFGVIKDHLTGEIYDFDASKHDGRNRDADRAQSMGAISVQPTNPMASLHLKPADSKSLAQAPLRKPHIVVDIWELDPVEGVSVESRLRAAWEKYTDATPADTSLGGVPVKAYNDANNPFFDSLTRLMQLRTPVPGKNIQHGTISVCVLKFLKKEQIEERKSVSKEDWYLRQKSAALAWKDHVHAKVDLPPDKYVEEQYQEIFPHKYPNGIDANYHMKQDKLSNVFKALGGGLMVGYKGMSEKEQRQKNVDNLMQKMSLEGSTEKDRKVAMMKLGAGSSMTSDERMARQNEGPRRVTTRERQRTFSRAHTGAPSEMFRAKVARDMASKEKEQAAAAKKEFEERQRRQMNARDRRGGIASSAM
jgi:hypothetical protein